MWNCTDPSRLRYPSVNEMKADAPYRVGLIAVCLYRVTSPLKSAGLLAVYAASNTPYSI